jgi:hypothetical protein
VEHTFPDDRVATEVHHDRYQRFGHEVLFDLRLVCSRAALTLKVVRETIEHDIEVIADEGY